MSEVPLEDSLGADVRPSRARALLRTAPLSLIAALAIGCSSDATSPTQATPPTTTIAPPKLQNAQMLGELVDDVIDRVVPAIPTEYGRADLTTQLQALSAAVKEGTITRVSDAMSKASAAVDRSVAASSSDAPSAAALDEIRLSLGALSDAIVPGMTP